MTRRDGAAAGRSVAVERASAEEVRTGVRWRYLHGGSVTHALRRPGHEIAVCGMGAWPSEWLGTGNQREYERAATLRRCRVCLRRLPVRLGGEGE